MFPYLDWWTVLIVYSLVFFLMAWMFQYIDIRKIITKEGQGYYWGFYFIFVIIATFCIGSFILVITNASAGAIV